MKSDVTVIIPTYNRAHFIEETLKSLLNQTIAPEEIIVVNDGSTDNTNDILKDYLDRIILINKDNGGKSTALNIGLRNASNKYIWICDDDDLALPNALELMLNEFIKDENLSYVVGDYKKYFHEDNSYSGRQVCLRKRNQEDNLKINYLEDMFSLQFATLIKKSAYESVGPFNEQLIRSQDYEMMLRISRHQKGVLIPDVLFYQRDHKGIRGNSKIKFDNKIATEKWMKYDQIFFKDIYKNYDIFEFTPSYALLLSYTEKLYSSLIQRSVVMAKRGLWNYALDDLADAIELNVKPSKFDIELMEEVNTSLDSWNIIYTDNNKMLISSMRELFLNDNYKSIYYFLRPPVWQLKTYKYNINKIVIILTTLIKIIGFNNTICRLKHKKYDVS